MNRLTARKCLLLAVMVAAGGTMSACITMDLAGLMIGKCDGGPCELLADPDGDAADMDASVLVIKEERVDAADGGTKGDKPEGGTSLDASRDGGDAAVADAGGDGAVVSPKPVNDGGKDGGATDAGAGSFCNPVISTQLYPSSCSQGGASQEVALTNNCSSDALDLYWLDYDCQSERHYGLFGPGQAWIGTSYVTHVWLWRNHTTGALVSSFVVQEGTSSGTYTAVPSP